MILNEKNLNYKVVDLVEIYNFRINFISIRIHMNLLYFFENVLQWIATVPLVDLVLSRYSAVKFATVTLPPFQPAVCITAGWTGGRMTFLKKKVSAYIFDKSGKK